MVEDICRRCGWKLIGGSCLLWRYLSPEICKELDEDFRKMPLRTYQSPPEESVIVVKVLCGFEHSADPDIKPTGTYYKYFKIKSKRSGKRWITKSNLQITRGEYEAFLKAEEEREKEQTKLSQFTPLPNPWKSK